MTPFEIIICTILYLIAYGYMIEKMIDPEMDASEKATCMAVCVFSVIYAPLLFGIELSKKLTVENKEEEMASIPIDSYEAQCIMKEGKQL